MSRKIGVIGAGVIGGVIGGFLTDAGEDVTLIEPWRENVETMKREGLRVEDLGGEDHRFRVRVLHTDEVDWLEGPLDLLFVCVKSYDTEWVVRLMLPYLTDDSWVVSAQNSINEEIIAPIVGDQRTMGCVVMGGGQMMEPAHVVITRTVTQSSVKMTGASFAIGELDGTITPRVEEVARIMSPAGNITVTDNLWGERWTKLILNCFVNAAAGSTGLKTAELWLTASIRRISTHIAAEAVRVGLARGYRFSSVLGDLTPEDAIASAEGRSTKMDETLLARSQSAHSRAMPSLQQDVIKGRRTEVDYLNGLVVRKAEGTGVPTPANEAIIELLHAIERGEMRPNPEAVVQAANKL